MTVSQQTQFLRLYILLLGIFGGIAAVLAAIGIYGVMSYSVSQRTRELGLRMALGADPTEVLKLVVRQGALLAASGIAIGLLLAFVLARFVRELLFDVSVVDPVIFVAIPLLLAVAALAASAQPAWRASRVDPTVALRIE